MGETKVCTNCKQEKELTDFHKGTWVCKPCRKIHDAAKWKMLPEERKINLRRLHREYNAANYPNISARNTQKRLRLRKKFIDMYGGQCVCCGDTRELFLTLDHIIPVKGGRYQQREYEDATKVYNPERFQILCMNCNFAKGKGSKCPCGGTKHVSLLPQEAPIDYEEYRDG